MSVKAKVLSAARWAADDAQEQVTGGFHRSRHGGSPRFGRTWLRQVVSPLVSDTALDRALDELVAEGELLRNDRSYRVSDETDGPSRNTIEVHIGIKTKGLSFHAGILARARALADGEIPTYEGGKLILDGAAYSQRKRQTELDNNDAYYPNTIRTDLSAADYTVAERMAQEMADTLLIVGTRIWFADGPRVSSAAHME